MKAHDYIKLAQAIKENTPANYMIETGARMIRYSKFLNALCGILAADNPKFDKVKFMEACK